MVPALARFRSDILFHSVTDSGAIYPAPPFSPDRPYPELEGVVSDQGPANRVYGAFRDLLREAGWDADRFGTAAWNPLADLVRNRRTIVIKPNLVLHKVGELSCSIDGLVVHASVLRVLTDYLLLAAHRLRQPLEVVIADTPLQSADFELMCAQNGLTALMRHYRARRDPVALLDLRLERAVINDHFLILERVALPGDPRGSVVVDLGEQSLHYHAGGRDVRYSVQDYDDGITQENHRGRVHRYRFAKTVLEADLLINLCKLKTHAKAGVTLAMKNIIGANVSKDYLPHFVPGGPRRGGDEFSSDSFHQTVVRGARDFFYRHPALAPVHRILKLAATSVEKRRAEAGEVSSYAGAWHGNDTVWRTIVDINRVLTFANADGVMQDAPQRDVVYLVDGICGMEGEGPLKGHDKHAGLLAMGDDPVEFDAKLAYIMGFDPATVPHIGYWREPRPRAIGVYPRQLEADLGDGGRFEFVEPAGWKDKLRHAA
jgi:uncharacterized protein (DUF362 family)